MLAGGEGEGTGGGEERGGGEEGIRGRGERGGGGHLMLWSTAVANFPPEPRLVRQGDVAQRVIRLAGEALRLQGVRW